MPLSAWLDAEIADVEERLAANPPMCTLDRQGAATQGLKELEGRHAILRRARRLLETGGDLAMLEHEVRKAQAIADASRNASPQWRGYANGAATALADLRCRVDGFGDTAASAAPD